MGSNREKFNIKHFDRVPKIISNSEGTYNIFTDCSRNFTHQTNYVHTLISNSQNIALIDKMGLLETLFLFLHESKLGLLI